MNTTINRRVLIKSSAFGLLAAAIPNIVMANQARVVEHSFNDNGTHPRYPSIADEIVSQVVGLSHFDLEKVKALVTPRPELARATWDWGFGDFETALGACSHTGRKDIAEFLMSHGARPDIFTYAMLGAYESVKSMIEATPKIQQIAGPHGISLLQHAKTGMARNNGGDNYKKLIDYLEALGDADSPDYPDVSEDEKQKCLGDYMYGDGEADGFTVRMNMRERMSLGKLGKFGGALLLVGEKKFMYNGTPSVEVTFQWKEDKVVSLTVKEPGLTLVAKKV